MNNCPHRKVGGSPAAEPESNFPCVAGETLSIDAMKVRVTRVRKASGARIAAEFRSQNGRDTKRLEYMSGQTVTAFKEDGASLKGQLTHLIDDLFALHIRIA